MIAHHCCGAAADAAAPQTPLEQPRSDAGRPLIVSRGLGVAGWIIPGAILAVLPKCPMCLAGYVALWTGIGLSTPVAGWARTLLVVLCVASLTCSAAWWLRGLLRRSVFMCAIARRSSARS